MQFHPQSGIREMTVAKMHIVIEKVKHQLTKQEAFVKSMASAIFSEMKRVASGHKSLGDQFISTSIVIDILRCAMTVAKIGNAILMAIIGSWQSNST